ncbi:MAG: CHAD domain-containing protein [Rhodospirillales bacterium]|nr:CHAD domain-containing protein [Rhodospirillales bacterium]
MTGATLDLDLPPAQAARLARLPALAAHRAGRARSVAVDLVWHDTPDGRLAAAGLALCERRIGRVRNWRLAALAAAPAATAPAVRAEGESPAALGHPLPAPLLPVAACAGRLRTLPLDAAGAGAAAITVLEGRLRAVAGEHPVCRVRLHGVTDPTLPLTLAGTLGLAAAADTLAAAALAVAGRAVPPPPPPALAAGQSVSAAFAVLLARQLAALLRLAPHAVAGDGTEPVHQMRVALRRLRSAMTLFRRAVDCPALAALKPELKALAHRLGPARDWDVFAEGTGRAVAAAFPEERAVARLQDAVARQRAGSYAALSAFLHGAEFRRLGIRLAWIAATRPWEDLPPADDAQAAARMRPLEDFAARALARRLARVQEPEGDPADLPAEALHALRIQAKRLRYAAEFFAPLYAPRPVRRFVRRVSVLQDRLGHLNDGTVAAALMAALGNTERSYAAGVVHGFVAASLPRARVKALRAWQRVRRLPPFWE